MILFHREVFGGFRVYEFNPNDQYYSRYIMPISHFPDKSYKDVGHPIITTSDRVYRQLPLLYSNGTSTQYGH